MSTSEKFRIYNKKKQKAFLEIVWIFQGDIELFVPISLYRREEIEIWKSMLITI